MLNRLHIDINLLMLTYLDVTAIGRLGQTSKYWYAITNNERVWQNLFQPSHDPLLTKEIIKQRILALANKTAQELVACAKLDALTAEIILKTPSLTKKLDKFFMTELLTAKPEYIQYVLANSNVVHTPETIASFKKMAVNNSDVASFLITSAHVYDQLDSTDLFTYAKLSQALALSILAIPELGSKLTKAGLMELCKSSIALAKLIFAEPKYIAKFSKYDFIALAKDNVELAQLVLSTASAQASLDNINIAIICKKHSLHEWLAPLTANQGNTNRLTIFSSKRQASLIQKNHLYRSSNTL